MMPLLAMVMAAGALVEQPCSRRPVSSMITMRLELDADRRAPRSPVSFRLVFRNTTDKSITAAVVTQPLYYRHLQILVRRAGGEFVDVTYPTDWMLATIAPETSVISLAPHGEHSVSLSLAVDPGRRRFLFPESGSYELKAVLRCEWNSPDDILEAPAIPVTIEPHASADGDGGGDWGVELAAIAQRDGVHGGPWFRSMLPHARSFVDMHPGSTLARQLRASVVAVLGGLRESGLLKEAEDIELYERWAPLVEPSRP